jgi:hypothetical protein
MIFPILGLPGPFTSWCRDVAAKCLTLNGYKVTTADLSGSLADVGRQLILGNTDHLVFSVARPDKDLTPVLKQSNTPILLTSSDPRRAILHSVNLANLDLQTAIRSLTGHCSCLWNFSGKDAAVHSIHFSEALQNPHAAVQKIADIYNLPASQPMIDRVVIETRPTLEAMTAPENGGHDPLEELAKKFSVEEVRTIGYLFDGFERHLEGQHSAPLIVTKELFLNGDPPHDHVSAPLDMTGRPKFVVFGPYIHIPAGTWMLRLVVSLSEEAIGTPLIIDVGASDAAGYRELTKTHVVVSTEGRMDVTMSFQLDDPLASLQVRIATERSTFDGLLAFGFTEFRLKQEENGSSFGALLPENHPASLGTS